MAWIEKGHKTTLEDLPIYGLQFLDGAILARWFELKYDAVETPFFHPDWLKQQKSPQVQFPSGLTFDIWEADNTEQGGIVHLFGEMDLPYFDTRDNAWGLASDIAEQVGYRARKRGADQLEVIGNDSGEHFLISYDNQERRIVDIVTVKRESTASPDQPEPLLDSASRERLPKLYANEHLELEALAQVKFFTPTSNWTWYASEASALMNDGSYKALAEIEPDDPNIEDVIFFGLVDGFELELGYFSLSELESVGGGLILPIERDRHFTPTTLQVLRDQHRRERGEMC